MSIITALRNQLDRDIAKEPESRTFKDTGDIIFHFDYSRNVWLGRDSKGVERIHGLDTEVPCYWVYCPNEIERAFKGEIKKLTCKKPHFVPIYREGDNLECVECHNSFDIKLVLDVKSPQAKILERIQSEKGQ